MAEAKKFGPYKGSDANGGLNEKGGVYEPRQ